MKFFNFLFLTLVLVTKTHAFADEAAPTKAELPKAEVDSSFFPDANRRDEAENKFWFHNAGEWMASILTRPGLIDATGKITSNGKRFDVIAGKRLPVFIWGEENHSDAWAVLLDGGMQASLTRLRTHSMQAFGTETFDGFFGGGIARSIHGNLIMIRAAHLSAHLVDNSPSIGAPIIYNQFWYEVKAGHSFVNPAEMKNWDLYTQTSIGVTHHNRPGPSGVRAEAGFTAGANFTDPDSLAFILSFDALKAGVVAQKWHYNAFAGIGYINKPYTHHRPFRTGISVDKGSDHRGQFFWRPENFAAYEFQVEF
jgi:hypothetical protein